MSSFDKNNPFNQNNFNLNNFKKWMQNENYKHPKKSLIGSIVESKISSKRLISRIETQKGELEEVVKDFKKNGGVVLEEDGYTILVEVSTGIFLIHKAYLILS